MKCFLGISHFLEEISPILLFSSISLHWSLRNPFLSLLAILWNSAFKWIYLSFSPLSLSCGGGGFLQRPNNKYQTNKKITIFKKWNWIETCIVTFTQKQRLGYSALSICSCSVSKWCPTLCSPMDCSLPVFPVLLYLPEFAQTHVHWVKDAIHPSHHLSPLSPALNLFQHQGHLQWVSSLHQVAQVLELQH